MSPSATSSQNSLWHSVTIRQPAFIVESRCRYRRILDRRPDQYFTQQSPTSQSLYTSTHAGMSTPLVVQKRRWVILDLGR
ncbi:hypothetical protein SUGI_0690350 [Cryptomeria japonica]|nr:hypothetical protein SUGI_0690350 [Cryptomeria japonica]